MTPRGAVPRPAGSVVLDSQGLNSMADPARKLAVVAELKKALAEGFRVVVASVTLTEVLQGDPTRCTKVNQYLNTLGARAVVPVDAEVARKAARLLDGARPGKNCTIDSLVVAVAAEQAGQVVVVTSDPNDIRRLLASTDLGSRGSVVVV